jgi:hypothetical protein
MTKAAATREAIDDHPFLHRALRAGVVNHAAAARFLDVEGDEEAIAAAVRRYGEELASYETASADGRVAMESGLGPGDDGLLVVNGHGYAPDSGNLTALLANGGLDTRALAVALERLHVAGIEPEAAGVAEDSLAIVVGRRDGPDALRLVETALDDVPA